MYYQEYLLKIYNESWVDENHPMYHIPGVKHEQIDIFIFFILLLISCKKEIKFDPDNFIGKYVTIGFEDREENEAVIVEKYENGKFYGTQRGIPMVLTKIDNTSIETNLKDALSSINWRFIYEGKEGYLKLIATFNNDEVSEFDIQVIK